MNAGHSNDDTMTASDALSMRQNGSEATIVNLRKSLDDATARDQAAKAALAKSDAVILELRSSVRQLKRQVDSLRAGEQADFQHLEQEISDLQQKLHETQASSAKNEKVGELQVQLDRAHAQILTADMVRKELEDTLEAEQYTWELRVQDQERQIVQLQQECDTLAQDLETCRSQWKEAEHGWNGQIEDLQQQLTQARTRMATQQALVKSSAAGSSSSSSNNKESEEMVQKISQLEKERSELQNCLDEALHELEAVDAELQTDNNNEETVEALNHLLRWILQESPTSTSSVSGSSNKDHHNLPTDPKKLVDQIQQELDGWVDYIRTSQSNEQRGSIGLDGGEGNTRELKQQIAVYQEELKSREASSGELRESLKEAVALLKPLQDAVSKAEDDKHALLSQLDKLEEERHREVKSVKDELHRRNGKVRELEDQVASLQEQVSEQQNLASARQALLDRNSPPPARMKNGLTATLDTTSDTNSSSSKIQQKREELRRKRETEANLQHLLKDAQSRFYSLHQQNEDVAAANRELQGKLRTAEERLEGGAETQEEQLERIQMELQQEKERVATLMKQLESANVVANSPNRKRMQQLENELQHSRSELSQKEQSEKVLNKSLQEALGLLRPLQQHLEEAEREKMEISKELRNLRKRFRQLQMGELDDQSRSTIGQQDVSIELIRVKEELEETVRQLEMENSQLHDALEDIGEEGGSTGLGGNNNSEAKLRQKFVELNSRYEVTQNKLEDAHVENHALVKALKQKELEEKQRQQEMRQLQERLRYSENELNNAKAIARSALVKVEELTMANVEQLSLSRDSPPGDILNLNAMEARSH